MTEFLCESLFCHLHRWTGKCVTSKSRLMPRLLAPCQPVTGLDMVTVPAEAVSVGSEASVAAAEGRNKGSL